MADASNTSDFSRELFGGVHEPVANSRGYARRILGKPNILVFTCENDVYPALGVVDDRAEINAFVRVMPVCCLGSSNRV